MVTSYPHPAPARQAEAAAAKPLKLKLVRDSFTMPELEYTQLEALKRRALGLAHHAKKSELLRAGIAALAAMDDTALLATLQAVPSLKTGRPKAQADASGDATASEGAEVKAVKGAKAKAPKVKTDKTVKAAKADKSAPVPATAATRRFKPGKATKAVAGGDPVATAPAPAKPVKTPRVPKAAQPEAEQAVGAAAAVPPTARRKKAG